MTKSKALLGALAISAGLPMIAGAQVGGNLLNLMTLIESIVARAIPILVGVALVYFIWNLVKFVIGGDEASREEGKKGMWWGIVALFVIVSIWGIIAYIAGILDINTGTVSVPPPSVGGLNR